MRPMRRSLVLLGALLAVGLIGTACGGDDRLTKEQYEQEVSDIGDRFQDTTQEVFNDPSLQNPSDLDEAGATIREGADLFRDAADEFDGLNPPANAEDAHDQLVEGIREFADDLDDAAQSFEDGNLNAMQEIGQKFTEGSLDSMRKIQDAIEELQRLGYNPE
jgi:hypothetical protein